MKKKYFLISSISLMLFCSCSSKITTTAFHNYKTECLGYSMDGNQTLRVWTSALNKKRALEQAKKKAVHDVVFKGINNGSEGCNTYPIIDEANAQKKYEEYFHDFFSDEGIYSQYVTILKQKKSSEKIFQGDDTTLYGIIVSVNRSALYQRFLSDNIIINK